MEDIISNLEHISYIREAQVDHNFRQGDKVVIEQLFKRDGKMRSTADVQRLVKSTQNGIQGLNRLISPYQLPEDYVFFLEYCGGLTIETQSYRLELLGLGPMILDWYEDVEALNYSPESSRTCVHIGDISFATKTSPSRQWVTFLLDVGGVVQQNSIIGLGPEKTNVPHPFSNSDDDTREWKKVADSFTEWLELAAKTKGTFGYI